ncbi:MAG TPA: hypothetical protein VK890_11800 [Bacteroidia bacterium]|jgi:hypothetical protein|nr:hypothetical protein [Bacteroidia bacterium]
MTISLIKEVHPESRKIRFSIEKDGQFVDGTLTINEEAAKRMYEAAKKSGGSSIWEKEIIESIETN